MTNEDPCVTDWLCLPGAHLHFGECVESKGCADCTPDGNGPCVHGCRVAVREGMTYGHDCEHTSMQHGADGCNVPRCLCAFQSWDESAYGA